MTDLKSIFTDTKSNDGIIGVTQTRYVFSVENRPNYECRQYYSWLNFFNSKIWLRFRSTEALGVQNCMRKIFSWYAVISKCWLQLSKAAVTLLFATLKFIRLISFDTFRVFFMKVPIIHLKLFGHNNCLNEILYKIYEKSQIVRWWLKKKDFLWNV